MTSVPPEIQALIQGRLDGDLSVESEALLQQHSESTEEVAAAIAEFDAVHNQLLSLKEDPPQALHQAIMTRVRELHAREKLYQKLSLGLCAVIALLLFQYFQVSATLFDTTFGSIQSAISDGLTGLAETTSDALNSPAAIDQFISLPLTALIVLPLAIAANFAVFRPSR